MALAIYLIPPWKPGNKGDLSQREAGVPSYVDDKNVHDGVAAQAEEAHGSDVDSREVTKEWQDNDYSLLAGGCVPLGPRLSTATLEVEQRRGLLCSRIADAGSD